MQTAPTFPVNNLGNSEVAFKNMAKKAKSNDPNVALGAQLFLANFSKHSSDREAYQKNIDDYVTENNTRRAALLSARKATKSVGYSSSSVFGSGATDDKNTASGIVLG